ncbi:phenoloxidase-activating factor 2-like [Ochlerotatus camptorhynchus]|uniref:phenoloxidase-activating factor 2-like n=1 Tax=Ochlerotatus camptorhynchus TaxID=644619 RepID=UPI0031E10353
MLRRKVVLKLVLLIGILQGSISLVASKCDGVCVKLDECDNGFGGINFVNLRFGEEDYVEAECPHYLEVCCDADSVVTTRAPPVANESNERTLPKPNGDGNNSNPNEDENNSNENNAGNGNAESETVATGLNDIAEGPRTNTIEDDPVKDLIEDNGVRSLITKQFGECGIRNPEGIKFRIQNSNLNETEFGEFPWMVAILQSQLNLEQPESSYACGGSLIAPNVVLTAAHCVMDKEPQKLTVRAGEWDTMTTNEVLPYQEEPVSRIILHPHFNRNMLFHDVALLVLETPFSAADNVQLACLAPQGMVFKNNDCFAAGWGKTAFDAQSYHAILKRVPLPIIPKAECQTALRTTRLGPRFRLHESFICAGGEDGIDTCTGDGGSPLVCPVAGSESKYYQAGIVAWGISCAHEGIPGVYVQASLYTQWIDEELEKINYMSVDRRNNL